MIKKNIIEKETPVAYPILSLLKKRYSPRVFSEIPITTTDLHSLLEAGRWAPSSNNLQPWTIIWGIKGSESYDRIFACLDTFNQSWASNAPVLWICAYKKTTPDGKENFHALYDLGLFVGNVTVQAQEMGIALHQMAGVQFEKAKKEFKLPNDYHVASAIALGYYGGNTTDLSEDLQKSEEKVTRERKLQEEFTFNGDFVDRAKIKPENQHNTHKEK
ncbi:hypothetical protein GCM10022393_01420 [Aquimarina addita]|uniref:Nitroreductase domain-containing protein n=1 Tax=Aquimarina addita TaxID=870485 RepID=A0ABP7X8G1_9FLAO